MEKQQLLSEKAKMKMHRWIPLAVFGIVIVMVASFSYSNGSSSINVQSNEIPHEMENVLPYISRCKQYWIEQDLDHFSRNIKEDGVAEKYQQRYFVCDQDWKLKDGPMFFYVGNEANVELYLNHSGLMWENSKEFGAMLVFAEHRYFGQSIPFGKNVKQHMGYLSSEQALADYAVLIRTIKEKYDAKDMPVIGFGGSYGGMLASWFRMKYPHVIDGAIAGSAPILSFSGENPPVDASAFSKIITLDATEHGGSEKRCADNVRKSWQKMFQLGKTAPGRRKLTKLFHLCHPLESEDDVMALAGWGQEGFSSMAMGNYPYPSSYIMNGVSTLPAYPVRVACSHLGDEYSTVDKLLTALGNGLGVFYNTTGTTTCYDLTPPNPDSQQSSDFWGYLYCTEMCMPFDNNGITDMFWPNKQNWTQVSNDCMKNWNVKPRLGICPFI